MIDLRVKLDSEVFNIVLFRITIQSGKEYALVKYICSVLQPNKSVVHNTTVTAYFKSYLNKSVVLFYHQELYLWVWWISSQ